MKIVDRGHEYTVDIFGDTKKVLATGSVRFRKDSRINGEGKAGTNCQELLRVLIDRVTFLDDQRPWEGNERILEHLRKALVLFEARHLERLVERGYKVENFETFEDGHILDKQLLKEDIHSERTD